MNPSFNKQRKVVTKQLKKEAKKNSSLVLCRTGILYGLIYKDLVSADVSTKSGLTATPNVVFNDNQTVVFFDFSDFKNVSNTSTEFNKFWKRTSVGQNFTVTNGELFNEAYQKKYDLSGTYQIQEIGDQIVKAAVVSVTSKNTDISLYSKMEFLTTPSFEITITDTVNRETNTTVLVNTFGANSKNSFTYLGAGIGDFISIQEKDETFEILEFKIDNEGKELVKIKGDISDEDRDTTKTFIKLYIKTKPNVEYPSVSLENPGPIGSCEVTNNGVIVSCHENQTKDQCSLRKKIQSNTVSFSEGSNCSGNALFIQTKQETVTSTTPAALKRDEIVARLLKQASNNFGRTSSGKIF